MSGSGARVACIGGATVDRVYRATSEVRLGTSNPVVQSRGFGGVARNVAESLARFGVPASLVTAVGADANGRALVAHLAAAGVDVGGVIERPGAATAEYVAVTGPTGDLVLGLADMAVFDTLDADAIGGASGSLADAALVFADCNLQAGTLADLVRERRAGGLPLLAVDGVSTPKVARLPDDLDGVDLLFLNEDEAVAASGHSGAEDAIAALLGRGAAALVLTRGPAGAVLADRTGIAALPAVAPAAVVDVTGAGDALIAGTLRGIAAGRDLRVALREGLAAAALALERPGGVRPDLSPALLEAALERARQPL